MGLEKLKSSYLISLEDFKQLLIFIALLIQYHYSGFVILIGIMKFEDLELLQIFPLIK